MRFRFIDAERAGLAMPIFRLCRLLQVSVSGFYAWRNRGPSQRQLDDMVLLAHVRAAFRRSRESYGAERVHHELAENGIEVGRHRVARLMRGNGLSPKRKQKFKKTTDSQHNKAVASNLLDQNFSAEAPNEKWAADISYIWTPQGWLYLAVMLDLYSRRVIGWAVGARMTSDLPLRALNRAIGLRQPGAGVIHHSDRGSQYCSDARRRRSDRSGRCKLHSPGRPDSARRQELERLRAAIATGRSSEEAARDAGVSPPVDSRWFRRSGGMPPSHLSQSAKPLSGRYLIFGGT